MSRQLTSLLLWILQFMTFVATTIVRWTTATAKVALFSNFYRWNPVSTTPILTRGIQTSTGLVVTSATSDCGVLLRVRTTTPSSRTSTTTVHRLLWLHATISATTATVAASSRTAQITTAIPFLIQRARCSRLSVPSTSNTVMSLSNQHHPNLPQVIHHEESFRVWLDPKQSDQDKVLLPSPTTEHALTTTTPLLSATALSRQRCIVPLSTNSYKGISGGRVAVLGGSALYTGAPYYAAMAALQAGADLVTVMTAYEATLPLKCYSPELMVASVYHASEFDELLHPNQHQQQQQQYHDEQVDQNNSMSSATKDCHSNCLAPPIQAMVDQVLSLTERVHVWIIGPGLGRSPIVMQAVAAILQHVLEHRPDQFVVLDADALYMLSLPEYRDLIQGYTQVVLTPNAMEYQRLLTDDNNNTSTSHTNDDHYFAAATIIQKGAVDYIWHAGKCWYACHEPGGWKRSGGIGDVLAGTVATLLAWQSLLRISSSTTGNTTTTESSPPQVFKSQVAEDWSSSSLSQEHPTLPLACWSACCFVKRATRQAFCEKGRSMTAPDVLHQLGPAMMHMLDDVTAIHDGYQTK